MALFGKEKETQEEKQERKERAMLAKYGLNSLSDPKDIESVRKIVSELVGTGLAEVGLAVSLGTKTEDRLQIQFQRTLVEQNFIIIRQLDRLAQLLDQS